ncbi:MAG: HNH endonuclease [Halobacteriaceae archaeon]
MGINPKYTEPDSYSEEEAFDQKGKYPPDWSNRRARVWREQDEQCGRCGREKNTVESHDVHHIKPLEHGGTNAISNLVGLCSDCHALLYPTEPSVDGDPMEAPIFPSPNAVSEVAVIRETDNIPEEALPHSQPDKPHIADIEKLEEITGGGSRILGSSSITYNIPPKIAKNLSRSYYDTLKRHNIFPHNLEAYTIELNPTIPGLLGFITPIHPEIDIETGATVVEESNWSRGSKTIRVPREYTGSVTITIHDEHGEPVTEKVIFPKDTDRVVVEPTLQPPLVTSHPLGLNIGSASVVMVGAVSAALVYRTGVFFHNQVLNNTPSSWIDPVFAVLGFLTLLLIISTGALIVGISLSLLGRTVDYLTYKLLHMRLGTPIVFIAGLIAFLSLLIGGWAMPLWESAYPSMASTIDPYVPETLSGNIYTASVNSIIYILVFSFLYLTSTG